MLRKERRREDIGLGGAVKAIVSGAFLASINLAYVQPGLLLHRILLSPESAAAPILLKPNPNYKSVTGGRTGRGLTDTRREGTADGRRPTDGHVPRPNNRPSINEERGGLGRERQVR